MRVIAIQQVGTTHGCENRNRNLKPKKPNKTRIKKRRKKQILTGNLNGKIAKLEQK